MNFIERGTPRGRTWWKITAWSQDRVDRLKELWAAGKSAADIAADLGSTSRNAVLGKVHRLDLPERQAGFHAPPRRSPEEQAAIRRAKLLHRAEQARERRGQAKSLPPDLRPLLEAPDAAPSFNLEFAQLNPMLCHYPYGDGPFVFCGHHVRAAGAPYCEAHMRLCYTPGKRAA